MGTDLSKRATTATRLAGDDVRVLGGVFTMMALEGCLSSSLTLC